MLSAARVPIAAHLTGEQLFGDPAWMPQTAAASLANTLTELDATVTKDFRPSAGDWAPLLRLTSLRSLMLGLFAASDDPSGEAELQLQPFSLPHLSVLEVCQSQAICCQVQSHVHVGMLCMHAQCSNINIAHWDCTFRLFHDGI